MFCPKCGQENPEDSKFCQKCGSNLDLTSAKKTGTSTGLEPNVAGLLCYLLGWITGLIFILLEKENGFIRFHALQSTITFGAFTVLQIFFSLFDWVPVLGIIFFVFQILLGILAFILWIVLMVKAYQGERYKLPIAGDLADRQA
jgi:uncharacterized membrane protein